MAREIQIGDVVRFRDDALWVSGLHVVDFDANRVYTPRAGAVGTVVNMYERGGTMRLVIDITGNLRVNNVPVWYVELMENL